MRFTVENNSFYLNDKKIFLNSGEIHYFRINYNLWDKHLKAAKDAGLTCVSSYVPWAWHEPEEGVFDFTGKTLPERNLIGWINKCKEYGLMCIVKPGPFILAEYRGAGLPDWFLSQHEPDIRMHNSKGQTVYSDGISLFFQAYQNKVAEWYNQVMPIISQNEISNGGSIIMMQLCNEIGVFSWLAHQADYNEETHHRFIDFIKSKYSSIEKVNSSWETSYKTFSDIQLPPDGKQAYTSAGDRSRDYDWHCFWRKYYADYLQKLYKLARSKGVTVPMYHNLPGWIYGSGYEFPVNITMYDELFAEKSDITFGVDHIPEYQSYRNMHDDRIINDITKAVQKNKPLFAAEFQSGSREFHVVTNNCEMELFYKASIANGLVGWNYYMFSQGKNPDKKGYSGKTFYWFTPLTTDGERTSAFPLVQRMNKVIRTNEDIIVNSERKSEVCVLFYPPYYATELEHPEEGNSKIDFAYSAIRRSAYFDGLLKALQILNIDYDMQDLTKTNVSELTNYKQVWLFSTDEMNASDQQTIVDYIENGGNAVIYPNLPDRDMNQQPCKIIRNHLSISPIGKETIDSPLIDIFDLNDIKCANPQMIYSSNDLDESQIIARTIRGSICGFTKNVGKGKVSHIGTWVGFDTESHLDVYKSLLQTSSAKLQVAKSSTNNITVRERFTDNSTALLFVGNYYNQEQRGSITYTHPETDENINIPYLEKETVWPSLYAVLSPICKEIWSDIKILHCTSDILSIQKSESSISITVLGNRDLNGEMVLEGAAINSIGSVTITGQQPSIKLSNGRLVINYNHKHQDEIIVNININK
ncbi:MAG: beta-galactosidase [Bacteroidales bacterium]